MSRERLQQIAAIVFLVLATAPAPFLLIALLRKFPDDMQLLVDLLGAPGAPVLLTSYASIFISTLLGANLLNSLKKQVDGKDAVTRWGIGVLIYTGVIAGSGLLFLSLLSNPQNTNNFQNLTNEAGRLQIHSYATWTIGTCLSIAGSLLGVPAPKGGRQ